jgi:ubiquinone/menaquinone biosynthesis C-methylase UbiE
MDEKTIEAYNKVAKDYDDETVDFWERFPRGFLDKFVSMVSGKVLDVGSGPGRDGLLLKDRGLEITCLDASQEMVNICLSKGLNAILGDFLKLPFDDQSFGGVWAYTSLLHIPKKDLPKALSEIHRVLKNDGIFALGLIEGETEGYRESSGIAMPRWFSYFTEDEVEIILDRAGFTIVHFDKFMPNSKNYLNFIFKKK